MADSPERQREVEDFILIKENTDAMRERIMLTATHSPPREDRATRAQFGLGFVLVGLGLTIVYGYGGYELFAQSDAPLWVRIGLGGVGLGCAILFLKALSSRLRSLNSDPYQEIDR